MNIVVLFSLILVVGMLVDGAIVTTELADRHLQDGAWTAPEAYARAAKRMAWPIIASTATTLSVFFPLLFWQGMIGEFMVFLPITVILTLAASLFDGAGLHSGCSAGSSGKRQPQKAEGKGRAARRRTWATRADIGGMRPALTSAFLEWATPAPRWPRASCWPS